MLKKIVSVFLSVAILLSICGCSKKKTKYSAEYYEFFDTLAQIIIYTDSENQFNNYKELFYNYIKKYHELYDIYNNYDEITNIKSINDNAGIEPVKVDKEVLDLLIFAKEEYAKTNGSVNVAMGSVLEIWHYYREKSADKPNEAELPLKSELKEAAKHTNIDDVMIDEKNSTVFLKDAKMSLDVGSVAKGYATEQLCRILRENGVENALISLGGNVRAIGGKPEGDGSWKVGIQNPRGYSEQESILSVKIKDMSVVTSGDYQRFYTVKGVEYHHIIDPETLMPSRYFSSVTIITNNSAEADALSTAVFNMPLNVGKKYINSLENTEAFWILKNGDLVYSDSFNNYINK